MSLMKKVMETVVRFMPDADEDPLLDRKGYIGRPMNRVDGEAKVRGLATFTAEFPTENLAHAVLVHSTIAKGEIIAIDDSAARAEPGVIEIMTYRNAPEMKSPPQFEAGDGSDGAAGSNLKIMQDPTVHWNGEPVAVVIAETRDQAMRAAALVRIEYREETADLCFDALKAEAKTPGPIMGEDPEIKRGNAEESLGSSEYQVDGIYRTPRYNHNAIEPHVTLAEWHDDESLTVHDPTQYLHGLRNTLSKMFGLKKQNVRVIAPFVGGAFGGKGNLWSHTALCVAAAKLTARPVKLMLSREGIFRIVGWRTPSEQRVAIGAGKDGKIRSLIHTGLTAMTPHNNFPEQFTFPVRHFYQMESFLIGQKVVLMDTVPNTFMRAPGESIGTFALESAVDEISHALGFDPLEFRRRNEPNVDPTSGKEFSSRHLLECYEKGAEKFGWNPGEPGETKDGKWRVGQGVACATYPYYRMPATARVRIDADGTALIQAAAHEMGMATATVQIQHAAERLGLPISDIHFEYGDSNLPVSPVAGGSNQTASIVASVTAAVAKLHGEFLKLARKAGNPDLAGLKPEDVVARDGGLFSKAQPGTGMTYAEILQQSGEDFLEAECASAAPIELMKYSMHSYGAQFCEVRVHQDTGEIRVSRWVGAFDCGRIMNAKTAVSQFRGGIIMGIGMALMEETQFDERYGRVSNPSLADYHVPTHLDIPEIQCVFTDIPDEHAPLGIHGVGEIGITGAAAAIANAVFNATGKRIRELPITLDKLM